MFGKPLFKSYDFTLQEKNEKIYFVYTSGFRKNCFYSSVRCLHGGGAVVLSPLPWDLSAKVKIRVWWVKNDLELIFKGVFSPLEMLLIIAICIIQVFGMSSRNPYEDQGEITSGDD